MLNLQDIKTQRTELKGCTNCFKSLGVSTKMDIYEFLKAHGSSTVTQIVALAKLAQPTVSHHLHDMQSSGLLSSKKVGKEVFFEVNSQCPNFGCTCVLHASGQQATQKL